MSAFIPPAEKKTSKIISLLITVFVVALLVFSGPASAVEIGVKNISPDDPEVGDSVTFQVYVDIETNERVPIKNLTLTIDGIVECSFDVDGNNLTACSGLSIEKLTNPEYNQGALFGYGYGYNYTSGSYETANQTFDYGYGYGYQTGYNYATDSQAELTYNVTWNTTGISAGSYDIYLEALAERGGSFYTYSSKNSIQVIDIYSSTTTTTTATTSTTSGGDGGGGGGSGTVATTVTTTSTTTTIVHEEKEIDAKQGEEKLVEFDKSEEFGIEGIKFKAKNDITNAILDLFEINASKDLCNGGFLIQGPGRVYKTLCLEKKNITDGDIEDIKIKFKVPISWIEKNNEYSGTIIDISIGNIKHENIYSTVISLYRFSNGKWNKLPTEFIRKDSYFAYFESKSPGLSAFLISGEGVRETTTTIKEGAKENFLAKLIRMFVDFVLSLFR